MWNGLEKPINIYLYFLSFLEIQVLRVVVTSHKRGQEVVYILHSISWLLMAWQLNTLRPRQYGRHFPDDIFKRICLNENISISPKISLKFVPKVQFNNIPALLQIMAWRRTGDKPLSESMMVSLLMHICVTRPQWVKEHVHQQVHHHDHGTCSELEIYHCPLQNACTWTYSWLSARKM